MKRTIVLGTACIVFTAVLVGLLPVTDVAHAYYHPTLGRFLQRDPLGYVDGMSLYQYTGGNPIVRTDPTGGCSKAERQEFVKCNCFCVQTVTITGAAVKGQRRNATAPFTVTINGSWDTPPAGKEGGMPKVEWYEWFTTNPYDVAKKQSLGFGVKYYKGLAVNHWHDMYDIVVNKYGNDAHPTFRDITPTKGVKKNTYTLSDSPGAKGLNLPTMKQESYFGIRASSTPNCGCPIPNGTVYAEHKYQTVAGPLMGGVISNEFNILLGLPRPPGQPPFAK